ncbi:DUF7529 family protein [Halobacteriaceae archaeon SHR40]|uniref:DUF7529 family protein n=1 Tax=Halovenus amylolytica TaxID=2500550 RepID=UPI000FE3F73B
MSAETPDERTAWDRTLEEATEMASDLRHKNWEVTVVRAGHVAAVAPDSGTELSGLIHIAPDDTGADLQSFLERGSLDQYSIYRRTIGRNLFLVTRISDPESRLAVILVGTVDLDRARPLAEQAHTREEIQLHVRLLDGTHLATFYHENPEHIFPEER